MKAELVAEQTVALPAGLVRLTLARHDDGHYSGVATLMQNGQRIGLLESEPPLAGLVPVREARVDTAVVGPEVRSVLEQLLRDAAVAEATQLEAAQDSCAAVVSPIHC